MVMVLQSTAICVVCVEVFSRMHSRPFALAGSRASYLWQNSAALAAKAFEEIAYVLGSVRPTPMTVSLTPLEEREITSPASKAWAAAEARVVNTKPIISARIVSPPLEAWRVNLIPAALFGRKPCLHTAGKGIVVGMGSI